MSIPGHRDPPSDAASARVPVSIPPDGCASGGAPAHLQQFACPRQPEVLCQGPRGRQVTVRPHRGPGLGIEDRADEGVAVSPAPVRRVHDQFRRGLVPRADELGVADDHGVDGTPARGGTGRVGVGREEVTNPVGRPAEGPEGLLTEGCDPVDRSRLPCHRLDAVGGTGVRCAFGDCHASPPSSLRSDGRTALYPTLRTVPISDS